jgi:hypothetical protein
VDGLHARQLVEQGTGEVLRVADAAGRVGERPGRGLGRREEVVQRPERGAAADRQDIGDASHEADRRQVALRIVAQLFQMRVDRDLAGRGQQQGVAVGIGPRHPLGTDHPAGAGHVVDDHRLPHAGLEVLGHEPGHAVDAAARRVGDDDGDRARRIRILRHEPRRLDEPQRRKTGGGLQNEPASRAGHDLSSLSVSGRRRRGSLGPRTVRSTHN